MTVVVVGGGISGIACARRLHGAGIAVRVLERSHRLGGRMAVRTEQVEIPGRLEGEGVAHPVDIGAAYFTVSDKRFAKVAEAWREAGLARVWTDTFAVGSPAAGLTGSTTSPRRWAATRGLRSLVEDLAGGLDVELESQVEWVNPAGDGRPAVDGETASAAVLAMPDPQAAVLLAPEPAGLLGVAGRAWSPVISVWAAWSKRWWRKLDGAFVNDSAVLATVMDDGRRRGDKAPVLVLHSTPGFAAKRSGDPQSAIAPLLAELVTVLGGDAPPPLWARAHLWSPASPVRPRNAPFALGPDLIGACGDGWGPKSRIEQAWLSGHLLAGELIDRLR